PVLGDRRVQQFVVGIVNAEIGGRGIRDLRLGVGGAGTADPDVAAGLGNGRSLEVAVGGEHGDGIGSGRAVAGDAAASRSGLRSCLRPARGRVTGLRGGG